MPHREYPVLLNEPQRLEALKRYKVMDTPPEVEFDHVAKLAADLFRVPTALVSFVGEDRQFFKARLGFQACETSRANSFCAHGLVSDEVLVIPDAQADVRFRLNPLVTGSPFIRFYAGAPLRTPTGQRIGSICIIDDKPRPSLSDHEKELLQSLGRIVMDHLEQRRLNVLKNAAMKMAAATPDAIACSHENGVITFWNAAAEHLFGFSRREAMGRHIDLIVPPKHRQAYHAEIERLRTGGGGDLAGTTFEISGLRKDGTSFPVEISLARWQDGPRTEFGSIIRDISERHQSQKYLRYLTQFDRMTGLPNRVSFLEKIAHALKQAGQYTVLKVGLDQFKTINGSMGMAAGDNILIAASERIINIVGPEAFVARLGGDEFGILVLGSNDLVQAEAIANRILAGLSLAFTIQGIACHISASVGIVLCSETSQFDEPDAILKGALLALQQAKLAGGRQYGLFRSELGELADERHRIEEELRNALEREEFELYFQPQVQLPDHRIVGAEALLRWRHPKQGLLSPAIFLPVLESSAIAIPVGDWILRTACAFAAEAATSGTPLRIGVNLFAAQLRDTLLCEKIADVLTTFGLRATQLELEITETTVLGHDESILAPLRQIREMGVGIAFDDYGTGFASLSLLKRYPLTRLKIDREFVRDLETDPDDAAIVKAVLALGVSLDLEVIAEGIETGGQAALLASYGCREAQGYLFGKPMPARKFLGIATGLPPGAAS
ncbi:EAL domain-containing protein [Methylobacterium sp. W2]|uniref:putative bifunctional diguanylate cyclase/phosphodiesterase n=1 Tax=Methylobacterium sp. W2 TaxID=2598107 RepID=UPI001D0CBA2A|nr:EAL domain-containing protein [Methylobacterium sp. W2]MCC0808305.1 EAL domain-containing protein [Methylobacterium sp. W2]